MEDLEIIDQYWARDENAISETARKYGPYCRYIAYHILWNSEDSEECVNDTYLHAWHAMPDQRPARLPAFLGKITRNLALNRWEAYHAEKRGLGQTPLTLDELRECVSTSDQAGRIVDDMALAEILNRFLASLPREKRKIFMRRYWYLSSVKEIAADCSMSESKVKMILLRARKSLKQLLKDEGISL